MWVHNLLVRPTSAFAYRFRHVDELRTQHFQVASQQNYARHSSSGEVRGERTFGSSGHTFLHGGMTRSMEA
jgi:hypothetical protein